MLNSKYLSREKVLNLECLDFNRAFRFFCSHYSLLNVVVKTVQFQSGFLINSLLQNLPKHGHFFSTQSSSKMGHLSRNFPLCIALLHKPMARIQMTFSVQLCFCLPFQNCIKCRNFYVTCCIK